MKHHALLKLRGSRFKVLDHLDDNAFFREFVLGVVHVKRRLGRGCLPLLRGLGGGLGGGLGFGCDDHLVDVVVVEEHVGVLEVNQSVGTVVVQTAEAVSVRALVAGELNLVGRVSVLLAEALLLGRGALTL